jgi:hypothetical protein
MRIFHDVHSQGRSAMLSSLTQRCFFLDYSSVYASNDIHQSESQGKKKLKGE